MPAAMPLRRLQKDHALILLNVEEFLSLQSQGFLAMPERHREHFVKVMRRAGSWQAFVGDGSGRLLAVTVDKGTLRLNEAQSEITSKSRQQKLTLVQAWIKPKALSLVLQKAGELGADQIHLIECERSHSAHEKPARMEAVVENACMQAYNPVRPRITTGSLADYLKAPDAGMLFGDLTAEQQISGVRRETGDNRGFINGPEGGFSETELAALRQVGTPVLLSENVLRSETAAIFALGYLGLLP